MRKRMQAHARRHARTQRTRDACTRTHTHARTHKPPYRRAQSSLRSDNTRQHDTPEDNTASMSGATRERLTH